VGLNAGGRALLAAASEVDGFEIAAVADKDAILAERVAGQYGCGAYDDYRQVVTAVGGRAEQEEHRCLLVAEGMYACGEYVRMAMKKGFNVLKLAPGGRDFEEAAELVRLADDQGVYLAVVNPKRYAPSFVALREYIRSRRVEEVFLIAGFCSFAGWEFPKWQSDPKLAGGGVLVQAGYGMVDQITWNFPVPQEVYALVTNQAADRQQRLSLTEDTSVVSMKFSDRLLGSLVVSSRASVWPRQEFIKVCGRDNIVVVNYGRLTVRDTSGAVVEEFEYEDDPRACMRGALRDFALAVLQPEEHELCSSGLENLKNMAVIESAYLSSRTGMPEEPARILQRAGFEAGEL